jgi:hypothetical protein
MLGSFMKHPLRRMMRANGIYRRRQHLGDRRDRHRLRSV